MRFNGIKTHGMGPFRDVSIDFRSIAGRIVAVCGPNGSGKSTMLELLAGALYRQCPTRGSLAGLATARDAYVEVDIACGERYAIRQMVDSNTGKGESLVTNEIGETLLASAKVRDFDTWAAAHLTTPEVLYSGQFSVQGSRGFLDLSPAERKAVLLRILGIERYERMVEQARERARTAKGEVEKLRAVLDAERQRTPDLDRARAALAEAERKAVEATAAANVAREALAQLRASAEDYRLAREIADRRRTVESRLRAAETSVSAAESALSKSVADAHKRVDEIRARIENNRGLISCEPEIRGAVEWAAELNEQIEQLREQTEQNERERIVASGAYQSAVVALERAKSTAQREAEAISKANERLKDRYDIEEAANCVEGHRKQLGLLLSEYENTGIALRRKEGQLLGSKDKRIGGLRGTLDQVRVDSKYATSPVLGDIADHGIREDDALIIEVGELPSQIDEYQLRVGSLVDAVESARRTLGSAEILAARLPEMAAADGELTRARGAYQQALDESVRAESAVKEKGELAQELAQKDKSLESERTRLRAEIASLRPTLDLVPRLDQAKARIEELDNALNQAEKNYASIEIEGTERVMQLRASADALHAELDALPPALNTPEADTAEAEKRVQSAELVEQSCSRQVGAAQSAVEAAVSGSARISEKEVQVSLAESDFADWVRLGQDLGKDGLQALEIDASIPELNEMANDLLHTCHGSRFTVEVSTTRSSADGKRTLEGLDVRVIDSEHGRDALAETYSGGECVIVGEAIALALTMLSCRKSGAENPTLIRDESGAALDPANGRAYIAMLRRAAGLVNADKVLFVSHAPELQDLADARIEICDGAITIQ